MNYNSFYNKPTLNHKELIGDNKASDIGGMTEEDMQELLETDLTPYYSKDEIDDLFSRSFVYREKSGSIVTFDCPSTSQSIPEVTVSIEATQSGSGDPSPQNVRPISGWSAVNVYDTGINVWDEEWEGGGYDVNTGAKVASGAFIRNKNKIIVKDNLNYYVKYGTTSIAYVLCYDVNNSYLGLARRADNNSTNVANAAIKLASGTKYINFYSSTYGTTYNNDISINYPSTDTDYHAYNGHTYTTALKDENDQPLTCYGGQLENVNGVQTLTVTHANIASYNGETINEPWISSMDVYSEGATPTTGAQVVYPLTTPTEIPQQSQAISTQDGTNNLWADSGDIEVKCLDRIIPAGE